MSQEKLNQTIRARVDSFLLKRVEKLNKKTHRSASQFVREAIFEKVAREESQSA